MVNSSAYLAGRLWHRCRVVACDPLSKQALVFLCKLRGLGGVVLEVVKERIVYVDVEVAEAGHLLHCLLSAVEQCAAKTLHLLLRLGILLE